MTLPHLPAPKYKPFTDVSLTGRGPKLVLLNDTRVDGHHGCEAAVSGIAHLAAEQGFEIVATAPAHQDWRENRIILSALEKADGILVNGEGTLHSDRPAARWLLAAGAEGRKRNLPTFLCNATWANNSDTLLDQLRLYDLIGVREGQSAAALAAADISCHVAPDAALYFDWVSSEKRNGTCVTDSVLPQASRVLHTIGRREGARFMTLSSGGCTIAHSMAQAKRMLDKSDLFNVGNARDAVAVLATGFGRPMRDTRDFVTRISGCEVLITGRFHAVILAIATGTPFLALSSNTHKIEAAVRDAGLAAWRCQAVGDLSAELIAKAKDWNPEEEAARRAFLVAGRAAQRTSFAAFRALF